MIDRIDRIDVNRRHRSRSNARERARAIEHRGRRSQSRVRRTVRDEIDASACRDRAIVRSSSLHPTSNDRSIVVVDDWT